MKHHIPTLWLTEIWRTLKKKYKMKERALLDQNSVHKSNIFAGFESTYQN
jgi:hypothetical protein